MKSALVFASLFFVSTAFGAATNISSPAYASPGAGQARSTYYSNNNRGYQGLANAYKTNQINTYYMVTQPDVDSSCRTKIYNCLSSYCGDVTAVPGQRGNRCDYASESELYNYAMLCLQKDNSVLLPQFGVGTKNMPGGMNTAARLCPSYVQQEVMSYLSMANMAEQLNKSRSSQCVERRLELEAAMSCHSVALSYGNETTSRLNSMLTDFCGSGVPGGSADMVAKFANAGNVGANIWGWAEKMVNLDMNKKGSDWQVATDAVLAGYMNRMNLACGENMQMNTVAQGGGASEGPTSLQTLAALAIGMKYPETESAAPNPYETQSMWQEVISASDVYDYATAKQVVQAGLTNSSTTQNPFLSSSQMDNMQTAYKLGTKVFVLRDSARCYTIPVAALDSKQQSLIAQTFASCVSN